MPGKCLEKACKCLCWFLLIGCETFRVQGRCEHLEKEADWVRAERDEAQRASGAAAARVKELEAAAARQKGHRRDETKKAVKEGKAVAHQAEVRCHMVLHMHFLHLPHSLLDCSLSFSQAPQQCAGRS